VRGLSPFPGAFTEWQGKTLKIYRTETMRHDITVPPGTPETDNKKFLRFAGSDGYLYVKELQLEGKKRMSVEDFLRGYRPG
jgi:methionyl-tRNA formyltransferase